MTAPIKWVGSKSSQLKVIVPYLLKSISEPRIKSYIEPFVGSGSVIIELLKQCEQNNIEGIEFKCSDINDSIILMYNEIKSSPRELMRKLDTYDNRTTADDYYKIRAEYNKNHTAEHFMYLNKRGFRGLYRTNKKGEYNTSFEKARENIVVSLYDETNILELSRLFNKFEVRFEVSDYYYIGKEVHINTVFYFDPPYYGTFNEYAQGRFEHNEYIDLLNSLRDDSDNVVFHSNSSSFRDIYEGEFIEVDIRERMNSKNMSGRRIELFYK
jgi:DNA adenine methylase